MRAVAGVAKSARAMAQIAKTATCFILVLSVLASAKALDASPLEQPGNRDRSRGPDQHLEEVGERGEPASDGTEPDQRQLDNVMEHLERQGHAFSQPDNEARAEHALAAPFH